MFYYKSELTNPHYNLALEEFLFQKLDTNETILYLWQNDNSIIVGRNQNTTLEVNLQKAEEDNVKIVRRNTGGGTVYHNLGNLNFSLIYSKTNSEEEGAQIFKEKLSPVIETLNELGVNAQFHGRNDIEVDGKKIAGTAISQYKNRVLQHGCLLLNVNLSKLGDYLKVSDKKMEVKAIKSVKARVACVNDFLDKPITVEEMCDLFFEKYQKTSEIEIIDFSKKQLSEIEEIYKNKYLDWNWTFAKNNNFSYKNEVYYPGKGSVQVFLQVKNAIIKEAKIYGDFLGFVGTEQLEQQLENIKYDVNSINQILDKIDIKQVFGKNFETKDILNLIIT